MKDHKNAPNSDLLVPNPETYPQQLIGKMHKETRVFLQSYL